jgi:hypothetical protein
VERLLVFLYSNAVLRRVLSGRETQRLLSIQEKIPRAKFCFRMD